MAAVSLNGMNTLLSNGVSTLFISSKPTFIDGSKSLPRNQSECIILEICVLIILYYFMNCLQSKSYLQRFATYLAVSINLCEKLVSSLELPITFDDSFKDIPVAFFITDFNLLR